MAPEVEQDGAGHRLIEKLYIFVPSLLHSACRSILGPDTEPRVAPDIFTRV